MISLWKRVNAQSRTMQRGAFAWRRAKKAVVTKAQPLWGWVARPKLLAPPQHEG